MDKQEILALRRLLELTVQVREARESQRRAEERRIYSETELNNLMSSPTEFGLGNSHPVKYVLLDNVYYRLEMVTGEAVKGGAKLKVEELKIEELKLR